MVQHSAYALIRNLQSQKVDATSISVEDRRLCVPYLLAKNWDRVAIANLFKVDRSQIHRDIQHIRNERGNDLVKAGAISLIGDLMMSFDTTKQRVLENKDAYVKDMKLLFDMYKEVIELGIQLGVIKQQPVKVELSITRHKPLSEMTDDELDEFRQRLMEKKAQLEQERAEKLKFILSLCPNCNEKLKEVDTVWKPRELQ